MEYKDTFQNEMGIDLNGMIHKVLLDGSMPADIQQWLLDNPNCLENSTNTFITESELCAFIELSKEDRIVERNLCRVVDQVDDSAITPEVFRLLFTFPRINTRNDILVSLCHKLLPVNMLEQLCKTNICFECYFTLICALYEDETASCDQLRDAINLFLRSPFYYMAEELYQEVKWLKNNEIKNSLVWEMLANTLEMHHANEHLDSAN